MPLWFLWKLNVVDNFQTKEGICTEYKYYVMKHNLERFLARTLHLLIECYLKSPCAPSVQIDLANLGYNPLYKILDFEHLQIVFFISVGKYNALSWVTISINYMYLNVPNNVKLIRVPDLSIIYQPLCLLKFTNCFDTT